MIAGLVVVIVLLVTRFPDKETLSGGSTISLPEAISLPAGSKAQAFTQGDKWFAIVTDQNQILIYDREGLNLTQTISIKAD